MLVHKKICSICFREYEELGNNASPINKGRCCDNCNVIVLFARINQLKNRKIKNVKIS
jgi:hypothetical protein